MMTVIDQLAPALVAAQGEFAAVPKTAENPFFHSRYADLASVVRAAQPILAKHGLAVSQHPTIVEDEPALTTYLLHESGQYMADTMRLAVAKNDPQGQGSGLTYARRYAYMAVLGLVADTDDDGNSAQAARPVIWSKADDKLADAKQQLWELLKANNIAPVEAVERFAAKYAHNLKDTTNLEAVNEMIAHYREMTAGEQEPLL